MNRIRFAAAAALAAALAASAAAAREMPREELLDCHSDVGGLLADLLIDRDKFGIENPEQIQVMEAEFKLFTAFALVSGAADPEDQGRAYLEEVGERGFEKYKVYDGRMAGDRKAEFVQEWVARNTACHKSMRADPAFKTIPRHIVE